MGTRKITFANGEYYHIFNRGVDKRVIFNNNEQLYYFFKSIKLLNTTENKHSSLLKIPRLNLGREHKLVEVVAYCLLPNHFHLLLKQKVDNGVVKFMQKLGTSYTMFFNKMEQRTGALFQGRFKATHLSGDYSLPIVASYVNLNYKHHNINPKENLVKSSIFEFLNTEQGECICDTDEINKVIASIGTLADYQQFATECSLIFTSKKNPNFNPDIKDFEL